MKLHQHFSTLALIAFFGTTLAHASTVNSTDVIYAAGSQSGVAPGAQGTTPGFILVNGATSFTFSATGTITLNGGGNFNDPDGANSAPATSFNTGSGSISGITGPGAGYLVGVFLGPGGPSGSAPAALDFTTGSGTSFSSLAPEIDQTFFIGDGLTGDGTGALQTFFVPTGATELYLGIGDAGGYNGGPGSYGDNSGSFAVDATPSGASPSTVPEPSSFALLGTGIFGLLGAVRRRFKA